MGQKGGLREETETKGRRLELRDGGWGQRSEVGQDRWVNKISELSSYYIPAQYLYIVVIPLESVGDVLDRKCWNKTLGRKCQGIRPIVKLSQQHLI